MMRSGLMVMRSGCPAKKARLPDCASVAGDGFAWEADAPDVDGAACSLPRFLSPVCTNNLLAIAASSSCATHRSSPLDAAFPCSYAFRVVCPRSPGGAGPSFGTSLPT